MSTTADSAAVAHRALALGSQAALARWRAAQQLGVASHMFLAIPKADAEPFRQLIAEAVSLLISREGWYSVLPRDIRMALHAAAIAPGVGRRIRSQALSYPWSLSGPQLHEARRARMISYLLMYARTSPESLLNMSARQGGQWWKTIWRHVDPGLLLELGDSLRDISVTTSGAVDSIEKVHAAVTGLNEEIQRRWALVENHLLSQLFAWPLLASKGGAPVALALPLAVDLVWGTKGGVTIRSHQRLRPGQWVQPLREARAEAWQLWRRKHGYTGRDLREILSRSQLVVDMRDAAAILAVLDGTRLEGVELEGWSAVPYLSQVMLSRFLGDRFPSTTGVSAVFVAAPDALAKQARGRGSYLDAPGEMEAKFRWARTSDFLTRLVLPAGTPGSEDAARAAAGAFPELGLLELPAARTSQDLADIVQWRNWRQQRYVRAAALRHLLHSRGMARAREKARSSPLVQSRAERLRSSASPVVFFRHSPAAAAIALQWLNDTWRVSVAGPIAPALSWAVIRGTGINPDELWQLVWEACDGDASSLDRLLRSTRRDATAIEVARLLNRLDPLQERPPRRSPDVVMLILDRQDEPTDPLLLNGREPLAVVDALVRHNLLKPAQDPRLRPVLGATRLVVVFDEPPMTGGAAVDSEYQEILRWLSVFEDGFDTRTAVQYLSSLQVPRSEIDQALSGLQRLPGKPLRFAQGHFHLSGKARTDPGRSVHAALLHTKAALALVPLLDASADARGADRNIGTERIVEACRHLLDASLMARYFAFQDEKGAQDIYDESHLAAQWALSCMVPPSWSAVQQLRLLTGFPQVAMAMVDKLTDRVGDEELSATNLGSAAVLGWELSGSSEAGDAVMTRRLEASRRFTTNTIRLRERVRGARIDETIVQVFAYHGAQHADFLREAGQADLADELDAELRGLLNRAFQSDVRLMFPGSWLTRCGDAIRDHIQSVEVYRRAAAMTEGKVDIQVKLLGAMILAGSPHARRVLNDLREDRKGLRASRRRLLRLQRAGANGEGVVRWRRGLEALGWPLPRPLSDVT